MLILSRKINEFIIIGEGEDKVTICITAIDNNKVKLGFIAGKHIKILRKEIYNADKDIAADN